MVPLNRLGGVFATYVAVLRRPGVSIPVIGAAIASLPVGMLSLAVLLLVRSTATGFSSAGAVVGMLGLGTGAGILVQGRLMDRLGHTPVLLGAICVQAPALTAFVISIRSGGSTWMLAGLAFLRAPPCALRAGLRPSLINLYAVRTAVAVLHGGARPATSEWC